MSISQSLKSSARTREMPGGRDCWICGCEWSVNGEGGGDGL